MARRRVGSAASCLSVSLGFCHARPYQLQSAARYLPLALLPFLTRNSLIYSPASDGVQDAAAGFVCTSFRDLHLSPRGRNDEISHFALCSTFAPAARREFENSPAQKFCFCDKWLFLFTSTFGPE